jgi:anti-sigma factor RsiW
MRDALDGALSANRRARLNEHVAACDACRRALADQTWVKNALAALPMATVSAGFAARVRDRIVSRHGWLDVANWRVWTLRLAPAALVLCLLAWWPAQRGEAGAQSLSAQLQSFATADATEAQRLALDAEAGTDRLLAAALGDSSR